MPKQTLTIEVDVPDGWMATGEYRPPNKGEHYLQTGKSQAYFTPTVDFLILRKTWQPPAWMVEHYRGCWLYCIEREWLVNRTEPVLNDNGRYCRMNDAPLSIDADTLAALHSAEFQPPPHTQKLQIT